MNTTSAYYPHHHPQQQQHQQHYYSYNESNKQQQGSPSQIFGPGSQSPHPAQNYEFDNDEESQYSLSEFSHIHLADGASTDNDQHLVTLGINGLGAPTTSFADQQQHFQGFTGNHSGLLLSSSKADSSSQDLFGDSVCSNSSNRKRALSFNNGTNTGSGSSCNGGSEKRAATKICRVCGDKAYSYNFNVITCESCKAFFRRNANKEKEIRCPFNESCDINIVSRRFCQRCRLQKCFRVGMKKEWIMSEEARLEKKQRIQDNRERRMAERSQMDSGSIEDLNSSVIATNPMEMLVNVVDNTALLASTLNATQNNGIPGNDPNSLMSSSSAAAATVAEEVAAQQLLQMQSVAAAVSQALNSQQQQMTLQQALDQQPQVLPSSLGVTTLGHVEVEVVGAAQQLPPPPLNQPPCAPTITTTTAAATQLCSPQQQQQQLFSSSSSVVAMEPASQNASGMLSSDAAALAAAAAAVVNSTHTSHSTQPVPTAANLLQMAHQQQQQQQQIAQAHLNAVQAQIQQNAQLEQQVQLIQQQQQQFLQSQQMAQQQQQAVVAAQIQQQQIAAAVAASQCRSHGISGNSSVADCSTIANHQCIPAPVVCPVDLVGASTAMPMIGLDLVTPAVTGGAVPGQSILQQPPFNIDPLSQVQVTQPPPAPLLPIQLLETAVNSQQQVNTTTTTSAQEMIAIPKDVLMKLVENQVEKHRIDNDQMEPAKPIKCQCHCQCGRYPNETLIVDRVMTDLLENSSKQYNGDRAGCTSASSSNSFRMDSNTSATTTPPSFLSNGLPAVPQQTPLCGYSEEAKVNPADYCNLTLADQENLNELIRANAAWNAEAGEMISYGVTENGLRRLIRMISSISGFRVLDRHDQTLLLKYGCESYFVLRGTNSYNDSKIAYLLQNHVSEAIISFYKDFPVEWRSNETVILLLGMVLLFDSQIPDLHNQISVTVESMKYQSILKRVLFTLNNQECQRSALVFKDLLGRLDQLKGVATLCQTDNFEPIVQMNCLLQQMFEPPPPIQAPASTVAIDSIINMSSM